MEKWLNTYLELFNQKPNMGEIEWRHEMVPLLIGKGLGYPSKNIRFEKNRTDVFVLDDQGIQHIVMETKSSDGKLGKKTLRQAVGYLKGGESYIVLASQFTWRVFKPGRDAEHAKEIGVIRFSEDGIENESLLLRLSREMMQDNYRYAEFRQGAAETGYIAIDERGFPKLVEALQNSVEMLFKYAQIVWPRQVELYEEYLKERKYIDESIEKVNYSGEPIYSIEEQLRFLEEARRKLELKYAVPVEAHKSYALFRRIQPYSGVVNETKLLDIYLREASHLALNRALLIRILEDKGLLKRKISNGGIGLWRQLTTYLKYQDLLRLSFWDTEKLYHHFFAESAFDWYMKVNGELGDVVERVLFLINAYDFKEVDRDLLSKVYQNFLSPEKRKKLGEFYTPPEVVRYLLKKSGWHGEGRLLDFSCGSGGFLVEALKQLLIELEQRGVSAEQQWRQAIRIVGFEIHPFAAHIAEMNLLGLMVNLFGSAVEEKTARGEDPQLPDLNVFTIDSLLTQAQNSSDDKSNGFIGFEAWPGERYTEARLARDFDHYRYVVGNPPYVRNERLDEAAKNQYAKLFADVREGNTDLYAFFIRKAFDWLEDGGRLAVIVSQGVAEARAADKVRRFVEQFQIEEIVPLEWAGVFMAATNPFLLIVNKSPVTPGHKVTLRQGLRNMAQLDDSKVGKITTFKQADWAALAPDGSWRLEVTVEDIPILNKLKEYPKPFKGEYGMILRSKEILIDHDTSNMKNPRKMLDGREVMSWNIDWQGRYVDYVKEKISDPKSEEFFTETKVVLRRLSLTAQAVVFDGDYVFRHTVMSVRNESKQDPFIICAIVNSQLNRYYTALISRSGALSGSMRSEHSPRVVNLFISPDTVKISKILRERAQKCHSLAHELVHGDAELLTEVETLLKANHLQFSDLPDSDFSGLAEKLDISDASFTREGHLTDGTLFMLKGDADALFFMVHHAQLAGKAVLKRAEVESYRLPASKEQLVEVNRLIAAWMERKPTLADQLRAAEAEIDELVFSATDLTTAEIATIKRRCTEFPLSELLKTSLPGKPTRYIQARAYKKDRYK